MVLNRCGNAYIAYKSVCAQNRERDVLMMNEPIKMEVSQQQLEKELQRVVQRHKRSRMAKSITIWSLIVAASVVTVSALWFPVVWSADTGQLILTHRTEELYCEDLVAWNHSDDTAILTVIGTEGEHIVQDELGNLIWQGEGMSGENIPDGFNAVQEDHVLLLDQAAGKVYYTSCEEILGKVLFQTGSLPFLK